MRVIYIMKEILYYLSQNAFIPFIALILSGLGTILINRMSNKISDKEVENKTKSFYAVYLPIYKYIFDKYPISLTREQAIEIHDYINFLVKENFEYVYPHLMNKINEFNNVLNNNSKKYLYKKKFRLIKQIIHDDYNKLAKTLNLPYESKITAF